MAKKSAKAKKGRASATGATNLGNYDTKRLDRNFRSPPACVYFYYIIWDKKEKRWKALHYYRTFGSAQIEYEDIYPILVDLIENARDEIDNQLPPPSGAEFEYIVWTRKSYFAIFVDDDRIKLEPNGLSIWSPGEDNYSFFDAKQLTYDDRALVYCINHIKKNEQGSNLGYASQQFKFKLTTTPDLPWFSRRPPDSGGTNMGPPVPPP
jgi:hypothetical protein